MVKLFYKVSIINLLDYGPPTPSLEKVKLITKSKLKESKIVTRVKILIISTLYAVYFSPKNKNFYKQSKIAILLFSQI